MKRPPPQLDRERIKYLAEIEYEARVREGTWSGGVKAHTEYQDKPVEWIVEKLGVAEETIRWSMSPEYSSHSWDGTVDPLVVGLEAVARGESIAVSAGTATNKTHTLGACLTLFFLAVFDRSIVLSIAPKQDQLLLNLWKEIGRLWPQFNKHFPGAELLSGKLRMLGDSSDEREVWTATAFAAGVGADEEVAQRLAGFHQPSMLWLVEETPGVDMAIMNTIVNTAVGGRNPLCLLGNPDHRHDTLGVMSAKPWVKAIRISALDHPNVVLGRELIPGAVTRLSIERRLEDADGDENDPMYLSRVRGIAPAQSRRALILWEWCEDAAKRWSDPEFRNGPRALGVDVADSPTGDMSAISRWQGRCCVEVEAFRASDASEVGRLVFAEIRDGENPINPRYVGIDAVGVGASTVNELKRLGVRIRPISGGMKAVPRVDTETRWSATEPTEEGVLRTMGPRVSDVARYANQRSQVLWQLREDLRQNRIALPNDPKLFEELTAIEYDDESGQIVVAPKKKLKLRLGRSPDRADSVAYGNWARSREPSTKQLSEEALAEAGMVKEGPNRSIGLERMMARISRQRKAEDRRIQRRYGGVR